MYFQCVLGFLAADYVLYDFFKDKFEKRIEMFGRRRLEYESNILQEESDRAAKQCATKSSSTNELCKLYNLHGPRFLGLVRADQKNRSLIKLMQDGSI